MHIFRQIDQWRGDFVMDRMALGIRWMAQRNKREIQPGPLEIENFLRNEGFRKTRVALQKNRDTSRLSHRSDKGRLGAALCLLTRHTFG